MAHYGSLLSFVYNYMHPGVYYFYALYDNDGNNTFNSGDWISTSNASFTLGAQSTASVNTIMETGPIMVNIRSTIILIYSTVTKIICGIVQTALVSQGKCLPSGASEI